jgi:hypothetical protein
VIELSSLREQLAVLREEARAYFAHAEDAGNLETTPPKPQVAWVMSEMADVIRDSPLLAPTARNSHQKNTRRMDSALRFKRYECWSPSTSYYEDIPITNGADELEYDVPIHEAKSLFLEALDSTFALLDLAEPVRIDESIGKDTGPAADFGTGSSDTNSRFPNRAAWFNARLAEREWSKHELQRHGGPEHRTIQKILDGLPVQEDVIRKAVNALRAKPTHKNRSLPPVSEAEVPKN